MADLTPSEHFLRVVPLDPDAAPADSRALLEAARGERGDVSGLLRLLAHSPAALGGYLAFGRELAAGALPAAVRERIAIAVAATNRCTPCLDFHTRLGAAAGLSGDELTAAREAASADTSAAAVLCFARSLLMDGGRVSDAELAAVRDAGFGDAEIVEIAAAVFVNAFTNAVNGLGWAGSGNGLGLDHPLHGNMGAAD